MKNEMKAFLLADRLIIDGSSYTVDTLKNLPEALNILRLGTTKINDSITAFFGSLILQTSTMPSSPYTGLNTILQNNFSTIKSVYFSKKKSQLLGLWQLALPQSVNTYVTRFQTLTGIYGKKNARL